MLAPTHTLPRGRTLLWRKWRYSLKFCFWLGSLNTLHLIFTGPHIILLRCFRFRHIMVRNRFLRILFEGIFCKSKNQNLEITLGMIGHIKFSYFLKNLGHFGRNTFISEKNFQWMKVQFLSKKKQFYSSTCQQNQTSGIWKPRGWLTQKLAISINGNCT